MLPNQIMNASQFRPFAAIAALLVGGVVTLSTADAQTTVATNPVGFTTLTATAQTATAPGYTFLCLNMVRPALYRGLIPSGGVSSSGGTTVLVFPAGTFTADQFDGTGNACYLEVTNGANAGVLANVTSTLASDPNNGGASTVSLDQNLSAVITAGTTTFLIRPHWTFGTAFGVNNSAGFKGSYSSSTADGIQIINPATGVGSNYYYNTTNNRWQTLGNDATNAVISPEVGIYILRQLATPLSFKISGEVKLGQSGLFVMGGSTPENVNLVPNPYPLSSVSLANSNLYTGNAATGIVGSYSSSVADSVGVLDPSTGVVSNYYYNTTNNRWQNLGNDASTYTIPAGASVLITRKNGRSSFIWYVPQPAMGL